MHFLVHAKISAKTVRHMSNFVRQLEIVCPHIILNGLLPDTPIVNPDKEFDVLFVAEPALNDLNDHPAILEIELAQRDHVSYQMNLRVDHVRYGLHKVLGRDIRVIVRSGGVLWSGSDNLITASTDEDEYGMVAMEIGMAGANAALERAALTEQVLTTTC